METHECIFQVSESLTGSCLICGITAEHAIKEADAKIAYLQATIEKVRLKERLSTDRLREALKRLDDGECLCVDIAEIPTKKCLGTCNHAIVAAALRGGTP